jgi:hypothetical protein
LRIATRAALSFRVKLVLVALASAIHKLFTESGLSIVVPTLKVCLARTRVFRKLADINVLVNEQLMTCGLALGQGGKPVGVALTTTVHEALTLLGLTVKVILVNRCLTWTCILWQLTQVCCGLLTSLHTVLLCGKSVVISFAASVEELAAHARCFVIEPSYKLTTAWTGHLRLATHIWSLWFHTYTVALFHSVKLVLIS